MALYPHNQKAYEAVMQAFDSGRKRVAVVHATGTGKSYIIGSVAQHFERVLIIAPNNFVLSETRKVCKEGVEFRTYASVMYEEAPSCYDLIVLDEFHRSGAEKWQEGVQRLLEANADAYVLGTSATHIRYLDNRRNIADEMFDGNVASYLPLKEAIDKRILPNPIYVSSLYTIKDTVSAYTSRINDSNRNNTIKEELLRRLDGIASNWENAGGVPAIIRKYISHDTERIIVFCSSVERAAEARELLSKWFCSAGFGRIRYYNIDYTEKRLEQEMEDFQAPMKHYDLKIAISVNMLNEGIHIPRVDGIIMLRSTISRIIIEQQVGRCLTANNNGKTPIVLDLVNNMDSIHYLDIIPNKNSKTNDRANTNKVRGIEDIGFPFKVIDECRDMRILLEQLDSEIYSTCHTLEECKASAQKYTTKKQWRQSEPILHNYAYNHGWFDECCAHMEKLSSAHTIQECVDSAKKYNTRKQWQLCDHTLYTYARRHDWLDKCCAHMESKMESHTLEECIESARKYTSRKKWKENEHKYYSYAAKHGWLDECCAHMESKMKSHTLEECIESARKYTTRYQWQVNDGKFYSYASSHGWLDECCAHMKSLHSSHTLKECIESARKYTSKKQWKENEYKYLSYAAKHGWLDECCAHMKTKTNQPN